MSTFTLQRPAGALIVLSLLLPWTNACSRDQYRRQADQEVTCLINEKSNDPRWGLRNFGITMDPRSRYYEPYCEVTPPMPPDDPAAHVFMHQVDCKTGWPCWHQFGDRALLENPGWLARLPEYVNVADDGTVQLSLDSALRLAYVNSVDYQRQLETLYLSALDVSTERFRLDCQFFGGNDTTYDHVGRLRPGGELNRLTTATDLRLERQFATAGELLVGFANSFMWQFTGPDTNATTSLLNLSLVQPLLRGAGRDVALERLTIVERGLLANLRAFQRYRQGFYTNLAIGESGVAGPQRRGGFFGNTGLTGFTGTGTGGLGGVGAATGFGRGGFGGGAVGGGAGAGFAGGGAGTVGGFIGLLQQAQQIRNTQVSLESQLRTLVLLEANLDAGIIDLTQVDQFRQNIETERATLLQARNGFENSVENYLADLGLPPDLPIELDDQMIRQFQFIDARTISVQTDLEDLQDLIGQYADEVTADMAKVIFEQTLTQLNDVDGVVSGVEADLLRLAEQLPKRKDRMSPAEQRLLDKDVQDLHNALEQLKQRLDKKRPVLATIEQELTAENVRDQLDQTVIWLRDLISLVQEISLVQARARVESIYLDPVDLDPETAFQIAVTNRLDIMNNRAALVDSWRLIQFNADALQSNLDIVFRGDISTVGNNAVKFRGPAGTLQAGLRFDAPFTRLLERNNYRQALIDYQQDRRQLIQFYDGVHRSLRQLLRSMDQLRLNLEIQRRAVVIAIRRVDLTREDLNQPTPPPAPGQAAQQLGPTAALNLLTALSDLRNTQNNFMSVWLNYYANQMRLQRDTGLMQLDDAGNWIEIPLSDVGPIEETEPLPPPLPPEIVLTAFQLDE